MVHAEVLETSGPAADHPWPLTAPTLRADDRAREVAQLNEAMATRSPIGQATGSLNKEPSLTNGDANGAGRILPPVADC